MCRECSAELIADFQREYGLDFEAFIASKPSLKRLVALVVGLSPGAAAWRRYGGALAWTGEQAMLSEVAHGIRVLAWMKTKAAQSGTDMPEPDTPPDPLPIRERKKAEYERRRADYLRRNPRARLNQK